MDEPPIHKQCGLFSFGKLDAFGGELPPSEWRPLCHAFNNPQDVLCPHADPALHLAQQGFNDGPEALRNTFGLCPWNPEQKECLKWFEDHPEFGK